ncbi:peptidoglycan hydrolase CwlO-like protein [Aerococcus sp. 150760007-1]|uniref:Uncharacterized protein n=1 Tax=Aerococcus urinaeequi TaxID=51665 RepID=A0ABR5ZXX2_9LACT|nr:hypothetical protein [Aerococcus urinaeequi]MBA5746593.1 hypothetical protein [Aerococcus urinaeequi]MBA5829356.1 hypothetical protein [Aerococcus urinaeequi]MBA5860281.1 hypothetical protein [Aerococcus urinaeequi]
MDNLNPLLIAIVPALLTYLGTKYKSQSEREQYASSAWKQLYDETKERMDDLQKQVEVLSKQMEEMKTVHAKEVEKLESQNTELKEENRQLRVENANYKNRLIELGDNFNGV